MRCKGILGLALAFAPFVQHAAAQSSTPTPYTDAGTGIKFDSWTAPGTAMSWGMTFPQNALTTDASEYIGYLECATGGAKGKGWCGMSIGGTMTNNLLLMAYPNGNDVLTGFFWATDYGQMPVPYTGNAKLTQISSSTNTTHYRVVFRCEGCLSYGQGGVTGAVKTSGGGGVFGWAWSSATPTNPDCPHDVLLLQHNTQSVFGTSFTSAQASYATWAKLATHVVPGNCGGGGGATTTTKPPVSTTTISVPTGTGIPVPTGTTYDYIVIGAGAAGIPMADRLSEAGKKVLLIEKGPPSSGHFGGKIAPDWLKGSGLTRFDVPGLCNQIWVDSAGIACQDTDQMAGCVLGGGTAINAGLWWRPNPQDWDEVFPTGWKGSDMSDPADRVFSRIQGTYAPSMDGQRYYHQGFDVIAGGLGAAGWKSVRANEAPGEKNHTYTIPPFMFSQGERGGPFASYLVTATARSNFKLWTNTAVRRLVRTGAHVTGVEVENYRGTGYSGTVNLTPNTGRVIVSSGTFGSAKLLMRSGIGPKDQLNIVKASASDGAKMISSDQWIQLPVGYNLEDHTNTDVIVSHPSVVFYDFYKAYDNPIPEDKARYLNGRTGILAQAAPNIGPLFFEEITGADGITRQLQWTSRVEGGPTNDTTAMTISQYLGRGAVSRGRMTITPGLTTQVSDVPYLKNKNDVEAVIKGIENLQKNLANVKDLKFLVPPPTTTARKYVEGMLVSTSNRRANHWIGSNKMGTADGRKGGDCVVDTNTKVYGTDNVFVVDASIFPGMITTNPSAYIMTVSEMAFRKIMALPIGQM